MNNPGGNHHEVAHRHEVNVSPARRGNERKEAIGPRLCRSTPAGTFLGQTGFDVVGAAGVASRGRPGPRKTQVNSKCERQRIPRGDPRRGVDPPPCPGRARSSLTDGAPFNRARRSGNARAAGADHPYSGKAAPGAPPTPRWFSIRVDTLVDAPTRRLRTGVRLPPGPLSALAFLPGPCPGLKSRNHWTGLQGWRPIDAGLKPAIHLGLPAEHIRTGHRMASRGDTGPRIPDRAGSSPAAWHLSPTGGLGRQSEGGQDRRRPGRRPDYAACKSGDGPGPRSAGYPAVVR